LILVPSNHLAKQLLSTTHFAVDIPLFGQGNATQGHEMQHSCCMHGGANSSFGSIVEISMKEVAAMDSILRRKVGYSKTPT
tara:strand:+ start:1128 stop:1370 length:243 start_codon:yes stop_codon:yes gene_type:complete